MKRKIVQIDEEKCNGCGACIPNCPEGAMQVIDGKARLISDLLCDGLGACLGHCPQGAISIIEREAEAYDERKVMANMVRQGMNVVKAHLEHLRDHGQSAYLLQAIRYLDEKDIENPLMAEHKGKSAAAHTAYHTGGCPGARMFDFTAEGKRPQAGPGTETVQKAASQLRQWPVQMHLISPTAPYFQGADVVLAADCTAYALGSFHTDYLKGKALAIACPKLDQGQEVYVEKIKSWFEDAKINTLTVLIMQVPCCHGLLGLAQEALKESKRKVPIKYVVVGLQGEIAQEEWL
ncbi:MAG: 4Fe-4S binding protein [Candidatus Omnitrophica bacterium]|nr:4Fe-4S binding protein [Candidatus Omnitrophota bacterium]